MRWYLPLGLLALLAVISTACAELSHTPTPRATPTPTPIPSPTPTPGPVLPVISDVKEAGQKIFTAFSEVAKTGNAEILHGLLAVDIRERCTVEQLQQGLTSDDALFPDVDVREVYVDLEDPTRVLLQVVLREEPDDTLLGLASALIAVFPFPMLNEGGQWRLSFPGFALDQVEGCPFGEDSDDEVDPAVPRRIEAVQTFEPLLLEPPPGATSRGSSSSGGDGSFGAETLLDTDITISALLDYYIQELVEPDWQVQQKIVDEDLATVTWTFRDDQDDRWFGVLLVAPSEANLRRIRLWMGSAGTGHPFLIPQEFPASSPQPVPAPVAILPPKTTLTVPPTPTPTSSPTTVSPTRIAVPTSTSTPSPTSTPTPEATISSGTEGCVSDPDPVFTAPITDLGKIDFILAPMVISGNRFKSRSYVWIGRDQNNQPYEVPVYAPVDSKLTWITFYVEPAQTEDGVWVDVEQYSLTFGVSCEVSYGYDHILRLAEDIAAVAPSEASKSTRDTGLPASLLVKARDLIGYTTGTAAAHNWDFVFNNSSKRNEFANQERYENTGDLRGLVTADCPYDYFGEDVRNEYYSLLTGGVGGIIEDTNCLISHDKPRTAAGGWFKDPFSRGTSHPYIPGWALAIGTWADGQIRVNGEQASVWVEPGQPTYADPKTVTSEHCYEHLGNPDQPPARFVYLQLLSETEMAVAFGEGSCPQQLPQDHETYYR